MVCSSRIYSPQQQAFPSCTKISPPCPRNLVNDHASIRPSRTRAARDSIVARARPRTETRSPASAVAVPLSQAPTALPLPPTRKIPLLPLQLPPQRSMPKSRLARAFSTLMCLQSALYVFTCASLSVCKHALTCHDKTQSPSAAASQSPGAAAGGLNADIYTQDGDFIRDIEVNDLRNRYTLTKGSTQKMVIPHHCDSLMPQFVPLPPLQGCLFLFCDEYTQLLTSSAQQPLGTPVLHMLTSIV